MRLRFPLRAFSMVAMAACTLAVMVARSAPRTMEYHVQRGAHRVVFSDHLLMTSDRRSQVVDTETGAQAPLPGPQGESLQWASFSDWVDERGEQQVAGRWVAFPGIAREHREGAVGLGRYSFPSGRPLDQIVDCPTAACTPCWYPGPSPRVLFAATDGQLYQCAFDVRHSDDSAPKVQPVSWTNPPAPLREPVITHIVWPSATHGRLIATVSSLEAPNHRGPVRLWWLRLSADGTRVAEAGPVAADEPEGSAWVEWCVPSVVARPDGGHLVAYQYRFNAESTGALLVAPLRIESSSGAPTIENTRARKLADWVLGTPPTFSPDARWVYALQKRPGKVPAITRFAVQQFSR